MFTITDIIIQNPNVNSIVILEKYRYLMSLYSKFSSNRWDLLDGSSTLNFLNWGK